MGIDKENIQNKNTDFDYEDGEFVYDVELTADGKKYEYRIKASDGTILIKENEEENKISQATEKETVNTETTIAEATDTSVDKAVTNDNFKEISIAQAKTVELKDAGISSAKATFTKSSLDTDDDITVYDIEFYTSNTEYDYEINASTGGVISRDIEKKKAPAMTKQAAVKKYIGVDAAKTIALKHANVSSSGVSFVKAKLENDDGHYEYEIEFYSRTKEYDYTVDALTGAIIEHDVEMIDD